MAEADTGAQVEGMTKYHADLMELMQKGREVPHDMQE